MIIRSGYFFAFFVFTVLAYGNERILKVTNATQHYPVSPVADFLQSVASGDRIGSHLKDFRPFNASELQLGNEDRHTYWFRFSVENCVEERLYTVLDLLGYSEVRLYEWNGKQAVFIGNAGMDVATHDYFLPNTRAIFRLKLLPGQRKTYLLRTKRAWVKYLPVEIYPEYALLASSQLRDTVMGISLGILLCTLVFQFVLYGFSKEPNYLLQSILTFTFILQSLFSFHFIPAYVALPHWTSATVAYITLMALSGLISGLFQQRFLKIEQYGNRFIRGGYQLHNGGYIFFIGVALLNRQVLFENLTPFAIVMFLFSLYASLNVYRKGYRPALYYFILLISCAVWGGSITLLQESGVISGTVGDTAMLIPALSSPINTLIVSYTIKSYKDDAEALIYQQNRNLEKLIADRTQKLNMEKMRADQQSKRLQLALRELNHRVRNNLAIVSSLLNIQSNNFMQPAAHDAIQESRRRIDAMALIHQQLYQSEEVTDIDIPSFINNLIQVFIEAYGFSNQRLRCRIDLQPLIWPVEKAIPLGLLINEVVTNAFKHGLTHVPSPELNIKLTVGEHLLIDIHDNGPGLDMTDWQNRSHSFGHTLINALNKQLKGQYEIDNHKGTLFRLQFPVN